MRKQNPVCQPKATLRVLVMEVESDDDITIQSALGSLDEAVRTLFRQSLESTASE